jgi:hypothetical protein
MKLSLSIQIFNSCINSVKEKTVPDELKTPHGHVAFPRNRGKGSHLVRGVCSRSTSKLLTWENLGIPSSGLKKLGTLCLFEYLEFLYMPQ